MQYILIIAMIMTGVFFILPYLLCLVDWIKGTTYSCSWFGWHNGSGEVHSFDGCSIHSVCSKCKKSVMQDSQGNWF
jgi:hypothetical protein